MWALSNNFQVASNDRGYLKRIIANAAGFAAVAEP